MGKKADAEKEEEYEYTPPDFDEDAFIHKELTGFRTTVILFLWAVVAGLVSWLVFEAVGGDRGWYLALLLAAAFGFALKFLFPRLGADIRHYGRKEWLGTGLMFFFAWLSVLLIALNPPVADDAEPVVEVFLGPPIQQTGNPVTIDVVARDNEQLAGAEIELALVGASGREVINGTDDFDDDLGPGHWRLEADLPGGTYEVRATATDEEGLTNTTVVPLRVTQAAVDYIGPTDDRIAHRFDHHVRVRLDEAILPPCTPRRVLASAACVRTVFLELEEGGRVVLGWDPDTGTWKASADSAGWHEDNNTFHVVAETADRFFGKTRIEGQSLRAGPWTVDVQVTVPDEEKKTPEVLQNMEAPPPRQVPGVGLAVTLVGLLAIAVAVRARARQK